MPWLRYPVEPIDFWRPDYGRNRTCFFSFILGGQHCQKIGASIRTYVLKVSSQRSVMLMSKCRAQVIGQLLPISIHHVKFDVASPSGTRTLDPAVKAGGSITEHQ
jgi:hypothetical protein